MCYYGITSHLEYIFQVQKKLWSINLFVERINNNQWHRKKINIQLIITHKLIKIKICQTLKWGNDILRHNARYEKCILGTIKTSYRLRSGETISPRPPSTVRRRGIPCKCCKSAAHTPAVGFLSRPSLCWRTTPAWQRTPPSECFWSGVGDGFVAVSTTSGGRTATLASIAFPISVQ